MQLRASLLTSPTFLSHVFHDSSIGNITGNFAESGVIAFPHHSIVVVNQYLIIFVSSQLRQAVVSRARAGYCLLDQIEL